MSFYTNGFFFKLFQLSWRGGETKQSSGSSICRCGRNLDLVLLFYQHKYGTECMQRQRSPWTVVAVLRASNYPWASSSVKSNLFRYWSMGALIVGPRQMESTRCHSFRSSGEASQKLIRTFKGMGVVLWHILSSFQWDLHNSSSCCCIGPHFQSGEEKSSSWIVCLRAKPDIHFLEELCLGFLDATLAATVSNNY